MTEKFVAPDGGWGWVVVTAFVINNIIMIPTLQGFALLYRNVFVELEMTATDINTIINMNSAFGLMLGLFVGPLLKIFGFRKVAMVGSLFTFAGFALCSTAKTFMEFMIFYGVINSMGFCTTLAAYSLAMNTYFNRRRNLASGLCTAFTGLGPVFMPFVISFLLDQYAVRGTALILAAMILHSFAGALLLRPVKYSIRKASRNYEGNGKELELLNKGGDQELTKNVDDLDLLKNEEELQISRKEGREGRCKKVSISMNEPDKIDDYLDQDELDFNDLKELEEQALEEVDYQSMGRVEYPVAVPTKAIENGGGGMHASKLSLNEKPLSPDSTWWRRASNTAPNHSMYSLRSVKKREKTWMCKIIQLFDFDLLKDSGYRNIWLGMSLAFTGELNFSLMTPLILGDKGMTIDQTAQLMSTIATTDIIFRFLSPFIGDYLKWSAKYMYMASLVCLVLTRASLTMVDGFKEIFASCLIIGVAKGLRTVYMTLVIPNYVPLEKLASASGLQTVLNGVFVIITGPALGYLRDYTGNYDICIHFINGFSIVTIILWSAEYLFVLRKQKSGKQQAN